MFKLLKSDTLWYLGQSSASDSHPNQSHSVEASYLVLTKSHKLEEYLTERVNQYHLIVVIQI